MSEILKHPFPQDLYIKLWKDQKNKDISKLIEQLIEMYGYKAEQNFMENLALTTQITIENNKNSFLHGYILYATVCKYLEKKQLIFIRMLDIGTQKGFNTICLAQALHDMDGKGRVYSISHLNVKEKRYWNSYRDEQGKTDIYELLSPWSKIEEKYIKFRQAKPSISIQTLSVTMNDFNRFHIICVNSTGNQLYKELVWCAGNQKGGDIIFCSGNVLDIDNDSQNETDTSILEEFIKKYPYRYKVFYDEDNDIAYASLRKYKGEIKYISNTEITN